MFYSKIEFEFTRQFANRLAELEANPSLTDQNREEVTKLAIHMFLNDLFGYRKPTDFEVITEEDK